MRFKLNIVLSIYCLLMYSLVFLSIEGTVAIDSNPVIKITSPKDVLFDLSNIKPGDTMSRILTVQNNGNIDFNYSLKSEYKSGSDMFYRQLLLQVSAETAELYSGKLSEFTGFENTRFLAFQTEEELALRVEFPWESGNEFQGLATSFVITLTAEGEGNPPGPPGPPTDPPDPPTDPPTNPPVDPPPGPLSESTPDTSSSVAQSPTEDVPAKQPEVPPVADLTDSAQTIDLTEEEPSEGPPPGLPSMLPKTGELNPLYFLIAGLTITLLGILLILYVLKAQKSEVSGFKREG